MDRITRWATLVTVGLLLAAASLLGPAKAGQGTAAEPLGEYSRYRMVLKGAGEKGQDLVMDFHARNDRLKTGWAAVGPVAGSLSRHGLERRGAQVQGRMTTDIGPVQYAYEVTARVQGGKLAGSYTGWHGISGVSGEILGKADGRLEAPAVSGDLFVRLHLASMYTRYGHIRHPYVEATVRGGKVVGGRFSFRCKHADEVGDSSIEGGALTARDGRLTGTVRATVTAGDAAKGTYAFSIDLPVNTNFVRGEYHTRKDGNDWGRHGVTGYVRGTGKPRGDAVLRLTLDRGIEARRPLTLLVRRRDGRLTGGIAVGGNQALHLIEPVGLEVEGGKVSGGVKVTIQPGRGFPPGLRPVQCAYKVHAKLSDDGEAVGTFSGYYGRRHKKTGALTGSILSTEQLWREFYGPVGKGGPSGK